MEHKEVFLRPATIDVINAFRGVPIDVENVYDIDVDACLRPIENPASVEKPVKVDDLFKPVEIYFDCETYPTAYGKHIPYLACYECGYGNKKSV